MVEKILLEYDLKKRDFNIKNKNKNVKIIDLKNITIMIYGRIFDGNTDFTGLTVEQTISQIKDFNGSFTILLIDKNGVYIIPDHSNSKVVFYKKIDDMIYVSNSLEMISADHAYERKAVDLYLTYMLVPNKLTFFKGIFKSEPAKIVHGTIGGFRSQEYFKIKEKINNRISENKQLRLIRFDFEEAVRKRLDIKKRTNITLGGLDSGILTGVISKLKNNVNTYSIAFDEELNDLDESRKIAEFNGTNHNEIIIKERDLDKYYENVIGNFDIPSVIDYGAMVTNPVFEKTGSNSQFFSGEGADPVFGGIKNDRLFLYDKYVRYGMFFRPMMRVLGPPMQKRMDRNLTNVGKDKKQFKKTSFVQNKESPLENFRKYLGFFVRTANITEQEKKSWRIYSRLTSTLFFDKNYDESKLQFYKKYLSDSKMEFMNRLMRINIEIKSYQDHLYRNEQLAKIHSVDNNTPYLDKNLIMRSFTIPIDRKYQFGKNKIFLAKSALDLFPKELQYLPKRGFAVKSSSFFHDYYKSKFDDIKLALKESEILDKKSQEILIKKIEKNNNNYDVWSSGARIYDHLALSLGKWEGIL